MDLLTGFETILRLIVLGLKLSSKKKLFQLSRECKCKETEITVNGKKVS